jgi:hypothetical protein
VNAFTNAAQKLGPLQRIEMERFAGTLLEAPLQYFFVLSRQFRQADNACLSYFYHAVDMVRFFWPRFA